MLRFPVNTGISMCLPYSQVDTIHHLGSKSGNSKEEKKEGKRENLFLSSVSQSTIKSSIDLV